MSDAMDSDVREVIRRRIALRERDGHERLLLNHEALRALLDAADERDQLAAAAERVRELHQDGGPSQGFFPGDRDYGERDHCCGTCGSHGEYGVEWPCPTVRFIAKALEVEP